MVCHVARRFAFTLKVSFGENVINLASPWKRVYLRDELCSKCGVDFLDPQYRDLNTLREKAKTLGVPADGEMTWGRILDNLYSTFVEPTLIQPTFVLDYPVEISPLAKGKPGDPRLVERFECFIGGMEVANAFTELNDPVEQRKRFEEQERMRAVMGDEEVERLDEDFLTAMEYGMPPTGGLGMGIDRLVMILTNQQSIREVILFPQLKRQIIKPEGVPPGKGFGKPTVSNGDKKDA
jgi:lysyl-tRNA synthetase class 2